MSNKSRKNQQRLHKRNYLLKIEEEPSNKRNPCFWPEYEGWKRMAEVPEGDRLVMETPYYFKFLNSQTQSDLIQFNRFQELRWIVARSRKARNEILNKTFQPINKFAFMDMKKAAPREE